MGGRQPIWAITAGLLLAAGAARAQDDRCARLAAAVEGADLSAVVALAKERPDAPGERARVLLAASRGDFGFLERFRGAAAGVEVNTGGNCAAGEGDHLQRALAALDGPARDRAAAADLSPADRAAAELLVRWAATPESPSDAQIILMEKAAEDFLTRFPTSAHRPFFASTFLQRYGPPSSSLELEGFLANVAFLGKSGRWLTGGLCGGGGLVFTGKSARVGFRLLGGSMLLRNELMPNGITWPAGRTPTWALGELTGGYRASWKDRHGLTAAVGVGLQQLILKVDDKGRQFSFAHGSLGLGYDLALARSRAPRGLFRGGRWLQVSLLFRIELVAFTTIARQAGTSIAPTGLMVRMALAGEDRWRERIVE